LWSGLATAWFEHKIQQNVAAIEKSFESFRLSEALMTLYGFIWNDFFSQYLEIVKPVYGQPIDKATLEQTINFYERLMTLLHPFMPFISEEIWHQLKERKDGEDCVVSSYPTAGPFDADFVKQVETAMEAISKLRDCRNQNGLKMKDSIPMYIEDNDSAQKLYAIKGLKEMVIKMSNLTDLIFTKEEVANSVSFLAGTEKYFIESNKTVDVEAERERISTDLEYQKGFVAKVQKKLSNERFVSGAPAPVVEKEKQKLADGLAKIKLLEEALSNLN